MRPLLFFCACTVSVCSFGQDWQSVYQEALAAYQSGEYAKAIESGEKAIALAKPAEIKIQAYTIQIITASCVESDQGQKGLSFIDKEIEYFKTAEPSGKNHQEAVAKKAKLLLSAGKVVEAANSFHEVLLLKESAFGKTSYEYFRAMADEGEALMEAGQLVRAQSIYEICLPGFKTLPDAGEDYLYSLFNSAFIDHALKNKPQAVTKLTDFIVLVEKNNLQQIPEYENARKMLSSINSTSEAGTSGFMLGEDKARKFLQLALANQAKDPKEALKNFAACEQAIVENKLVNKTSFSFYLNYGRFLYTINDFTRAALMARNAIQQATQLFAANSPELGHAQVLEADLALRAGKKPEAFSLYDQGIKNLKNEKPEVFAKQSRWVSEQLISAGMDNEAISILTLTINDPSFQNYTITEKILLNKVNATAYLESRQAEKLIKYINAKIPGEENIDLQQTYLLVIAQAHREIGNWNLAVDELVKALSLKSTGTMASELHYELARLHQQHGDFKGAEINYGKAVETLPASVSAATLGPQLYNSFATFYIELGNYEAAEKLCLELLSKRKDNSAFYNTVRQNLASMYEHTGNFEEAKSLLVRTVKSDKELLGETHPDYAISLQNLAAVYQRTGVLDSAQLLYEKALAIDKAYYGEQSVSYATKLANLGTVYQDLENFQKARAMLEQSLSIRKKLLNTDHPDYAYNLYNLGFLHYRMHQNREALPYFQQAAAYYLKQIKDVFPVLSDYERTAFYNKIREVIQGYEMFMAENASVDESLRGELFNFRLETKALLLSSSIKVRNQIMRSKNNDLISKFAVWQHTKEQLAFLFSLSQAERDENMNLITEFTQKANDLEKWLSLQSETFAASYAQRSVDWKKIQSALKPGEGAMEIVRVKLPHKDSVIYASLIVKPNGQRPELIVLPNGKDLEGRLFRRYINGIRFLDEDHVSYGNYWKKIDAALQDVKMLYLSPDGVFNKINCLTFFDPLAKRYVIDRLQIQLVSNLKELLVSETHTQQRSAALIGFPDYRMQGSKTPNDFTGNVRSTNLFFNMMERGISDLPATNQEVVKIKGTLESNQWQVSTYLREKALEEEIKALHNPGILHIATHGFFIAPNREDAPHVFGHDLSNIENNVLLRSGLLLAGAEKNVMDKIMGQQRSQSEDGVLTAYEVINLTLDKTELVVLSACETGSGDVRNGEGVYGLQRAFILAGAKNLIMSLWKVDDEATQQLMTGFYSAWVKEGDKTKAFHNAQLALKKKFSLPYYWGAFVTVGNR